jgi:hypothetical protein
MMVGIRGWNAGCSIQIVVYRNSMAQTQFHFRQETWRELAAQELPLTQARAAEFAEFTGLTGFAGSGPGSHIFFGLLSQSLIGGTRLAPEHF